MDKSLTSKEAAKFLGISYPTLSRWLADKKIACIQVKKRGKRKFLRSYLNKWLKDHMTDKN